MRVGTGKLGVGVGDGVGDGVGEGGTVSVGDGGGRLGLAVGVGCSEGVTGGVDVTVGAAAQAASNRQAAELSPRRMFHVACAPRATGSHPGHYLIDYGSGLG